MDSNIYMNDCEIKFFRAIMLISKKINEIYISEKNKIENNKIENNKIKNSLFCYYPNKHFGYRNYNIINFNNIIKSKNINKIEYNVYGQVFYKIPEIKQKIIKNEIINKQKYNDIICQIIY